MLVCFLNFGKDDIFHIEKEEFDFSYIKYVVFQGLNLYNKVVKESNYGISCFSKWFKRKRNIRL